MILASRRSFLTGLTAALIVAPSIVRASSLMPVKAFDPFYRRYIWDYCIGTDEMMLRCDVAQFPLPTPKYVNVVSEQTAMKLLGRDNVLGMKPAPGEQLNIMRAVSGVELMSGGPVSWQEFYQGKPCSNNTGDA